MNIRAAGTLKAREKQVSSPMQGTLLNSKNRFSQIKGKFNVSAFLNKHCEVLVSCSDLVTQNFFKLHVSS